MSVVPDTMSPSRARRISAVSSRRGDSSGGIPPAPPVRKLRRTATRMTVSIGVAAVVVMATAVPAPDSTVSPGVRLSADSTALIMGGTSGPRPDETYIEIVKNQYITPTHPGQHIDYVAVTTPEELWPFTGATRLIGFVFGDPRLFGPGGPAWPDVPWWKLSGLFDLTADQSVQAGAADLEAAMAEYGNDHLVIYGFSQGAGVANVEKRRLSAQYPAGTIAPDIDFVLSGDPNLPNGGLLSRFPGLYIPILDFSFNGAAATDTQFDTVEINRQYDGFSDFPLYPLNVIADLNAVLGIVYLHTNSFDVSLAPDASTSPAFQDTYGDTSYYFFETQDLPLFAPLRQLGVPEPMIDVVEPFFRVLVDLGYDRSIPPWEPTAARLIPTLDPAKVTADLVNAIGEGINNAAALFGAPPLLNIPAAQALNAIESQPPEPPADTHDDFAATHRAGGRETADQDATADQDLSGPGTDLKVVSRDVGDGVSQVLTAVGSQPPARRAVTQDNLETSQPTVRREPAAIRDQIIETNGAVKSVIGNGRTIVRSVSGDNGSHPATTTPTRKTPVRDAITNASGDIKKVVTTVSDSIKTALSGGKDDNNNGDGGEGEAQ